MRFDVGRDKQLGLAGIHWGALLFTAVIAIGVLALARPLLTAPLPSAPAEVAAADELEPLDVPTPIPAALHSRWYTQTVSPVIDVGEIGE